MGRCFRRIGEWVDHLCTGMKISAMSEFRESGGGMFFFALVRDVTDSSASGECFVSEALASHPVAFAGKFLGNISGKAYFCSTG